MEDKDKLIASLRMQLKKALQMCSALEQENALLNYEIEELKKGFKKDVVQMLCKRQKINP